MRYKVKGYEVRSENAAKSVVQASRYLLEWIASQGDLGETLDFGCGKLRYAIALAPRCRRLTLVDSEIQLNRIQIIKGERTTVRDFTATQWAHARAMNLEQFESDSRKYDLALCTNVLSAIPSARIRSRILCDIARRLKVNGKALFVTQFRNTYFKKISESPGAIPYLDGWLVVGPRGSSYYGILDKSKLVTLVSKNGFEVVNSWVIRESAYVLAKCIS